MTQGWARTFPARRLGRKLPGSSGACSGHERVTGCVAVTQVAPGRGAGKGRDSAGERRRVMGRRGAEGREGNRAGPVRRQCQNKEAFGLQAEDPCRL